MDKPKVEVKQVNTYEITIDGKKYTDFILQSEWEGLSKFMRKSDGTVLILNDPVTFDSLFSGVFSKDQESTTLDIIKASPSLYPSSTRGMKDADKKT